VTKLEGQDECGTFWEIVLHS